MREQLYLWGHRVVPIIPTAGAKMHLWNASDPITAPAFGASVLMVCGARITARPAVAVPVSEWRQAHDLVLCKRCKAAFAKEGRSVAAPRLNPKGKQR